jgi:ABC-type protease/lipase transport system fused ATPase/permease subunit
VKIWFDCIHSGKQLSAPVSIGYKTAVAGHMANLSYQQKKRIKLQEAMNRSPKY